jgi:hypothetical protein
VCSSALFVPFLSHSLLAFFSPHFFLFIFSQSFLFVRLHLSSLLSSLFCLQLLPNQVLLLQQSLAPLLLLLLLLLLLANRNKQQSPPNLLKPHSSLQSQQSHLAPILTRVCSKKQLFQLPFRSFVFLLFLFPLFDIPFEPRGKSALSKERNEHMSKIKEVENASSNPYPFFHRSFLCFFCSSLYLLSFSFLIFLFFISSFFFSLSCLIAKACSFSLKQHEMMTRKLLKFSLLIAHCSSDCSSAIIDCSPFVCFLFSSDIPQLVEDMTDGEHSRGGSGDEDDDDDDL